MSGPSDVALSARELDDWLTDARPALDRAGISAVHGAGPRLVGDGPTWVSFSSPWGSGRLVRHADGSSRSTAHRYRDGFPVLSSNAADTTSRQLDAVVAAVSRS